MHYQTFVYTAREMSSIECMKCWNSETKPPSTSAIKWSLVQVFSDLLEILIPLLTLTKVRSAKHFDLKGRRQLEDAVKPDDISGADRKKGSRLARKNKIVVKILIQ